MISRATLAFVAVAAPALCLAQATHDVSWQDIYIDDVIYNECTNEYVHLTGVDQFHLQWTFDPDAGVHVMQHDSLQGVDGVGVTSGNTYRAVGAASTNGYSRGPSVAVTTVVPFLLVSRGSEPDFHGMFIYHVTVNADGTTTAVKDSFQVTCH
jgi:hypothetical protein